jgi:hypothetical protein
MNMRQDKTYLRARHDSTDMKQETGVTISGIIFKPIMKAERYCGGKQIRTAGGRRTVNP